MASKELISLPFLKKDDPLDKSNYRPVSILPFISKVFERLIYNQLSEYTESYLNHMWFQKGSQHTTRTFQITPVLVKEAR